MAEIQFGNELETGGLFRYLERIFLFDVGWLVALFLPLNLDPSGPHAVNHPRLSSLYNSGV